MKKALPFILLSAGALHAADCEPEAPKCYTQDPCEQCYCLGPASIIANAPVGPITCDGDISIGVSAFYWKAQQEGLEYAIENVGSFDPSSSSLDDLFSLNNLIDSHYISPNFKWDFGFKIEIGYTNPCDGWDIGLSWTHFKGKASSHDEAEVSDNHTFIPLWSAYQIPETSPIVVFPDLLVIDIQTQWNLHLDLVDLELGRDFWVSRYLSFRPFVGLRYGLLEQSFTILQAGFVFLIVPDGNIANDEIDLNNDFRGIGPRVGMDLSWNVGCGFGLYSTLAAALLYGRFNVKHDERLREAVSPFSKLQFLTTEDHFRASRASLDLQFGVEYAALICDCRYGISGRLGWEQHLFFHQNQLWRVTRHSAIGDASLPNNHGENVHQQRRGNLCTQGLTLSLRFDF